MSELREQLSRRLIKIAAKTIEDATFGEIKGEARLIADLQFSDLADEVIRQMEWVRHSYLLERISEGRHDAPRWAHEVYESIRDGVLTLAPPEWKP